MTAENTTTEANDINGPARIQRANKRFKAIGAARNHEEYDAYQMHAAQLASGQHALGNIR
ncbi:MAG: hypothetical protein ACRD10_09030 [Terriglobia bacterium]